MSSAVTGKGVPVKVPNRSIRLSVLRLVRMAVAFVVVAGSLGLATVTATAQSGGSSCPSDGADNYSDVVAGSTHADNIACLKELGIPAEGDTYRPGVDMTRSEMARFMAGVYAAATGSAADVAVHAFTDVAGDPNEEDIARIAGLGITTGTTDTTYSPNDPVIRAHMALFLTRLYKAVAGSDAPAGDTEFTDIAERSAEQQAAIGQIFALGVTTGTTDTTYSPSNNVTREQMASFVARMYRALDALPDPSEAPGAPTGVEVAISGEDGDALDVSWTAPEESGTSDVTSYVVQWKSGDDDYSEDNQSSVDDTSSNFADLTQGDTYTFRVAAVSGDGQGDWSDEASGNPAVAPGLVGELTSTPGNSTLALSWTAPEDDGGSEITGYLVSWRTGRQASADTADVAGDATGYTITGLRNTANYSVWVAAVNAAGTGETASVPVGTANVSVSPTPTAATAPQNVTVSQHPTSPGEGLIVSWTAPADDGGTVLLNYTVENRCGDTSAWGNAQPITPVANKQVQNAAIIDLETGDACEVRVRANSEEFVDSDDDGMHDPTDNADNVKNSPWAEGSGTPVTDPGAPGGVAVVTAHQSLQVTWNAPAADDGGDGGSDVTGYKVIWTAGVPAEATVPAEPRTYTITGLNNQYQYAVTIKAITAVGESDASDPAVNGDPAPVPAAPTNVKAAPPPVVAGEEDDHSGETLVVTWNAPPSNGTGAVTGYVVQYRLSTTFNAEGEVDTLAVAWPADGADTSGVTVDNAKRSATITGLTEGTSYDVRVQADNEDAMVPTSGAGPFGHTSGTPATLPGEIATASTEVETGYTTLTVTWAPPVTGGSDITHYLVRYAQNLSGNEPYSSNIRVNAPLTRTTLTGLAVGVPYVIQIQAVNGIGTGPNTGDGTPGVSTDDLTATGATNLVASAPSSVTAVPKAPEGDYDGDGTMLTVTWSKVTAVNGSGPVASYTVEVFDTDSQSPSWVATEVADPTDTTVDVPNVTAGNTYLVRVRANTTVDGSNGYLLGTVTAAGVPATPGTVRATIDSTTSSTVNVTWDSVPEMELDDTTITGYVVAWFNTSNQVTGSRGAASVSGAGTGEYTITGLNPGQYIVTVQAVNHVGKSVAGMPTGTAGQDDGPPIVPVPE